MANIVHIDNEDSGNSIIEIEAPKKPAPLVIDLADEEIVINVKADIPSTPLSPGVPWVSQYDMSTGDLGESHEEENVEVYEMSKEDNKENINVEEENNEVTEDENDDVVEEEEDNEEENDEVTEDENGESIEAIKEENDEATEDENGESLEVIKEENEEVVKDENEGNEEVVEDENRGNEEVTEGENEENGVVIDEKETNEAVQSIIEIKNREKGESNDNERCDEGDGENDEMGEQEKVGKKTGKKRSSENEGDKQGEEKKDETRQNNEGRQNNQSRDDNQCQPGPSHFDPQASYSQGSYSLASFSRPSFSRPSYIHDPYALMSANPPRGDDPGPHHPEHWTPEMVKFYDEDWGNEKDFVVEKLQEGMDKDPSLWEISSRDVAYWKNKDKKPPMRCYNCFDCGHESYDCPEEERVPKCHMCGIPGHIAYKCPDSLCLNCGTATTGYVTKCKNCTFGLDKVCERCNLTGHIYSECTDHWRLYHSTVGTKRVDQPRHDIYKPIRNRWCCNCGRQGHLQVECDFCVKNCEFSDTLPFVSSYIKAFTRGSQLAYGYEEPEGPKRLKINAEDNIMTNPSQKHVFQRKTSQLRNKLKSLARDAMLRDRERNSDRRRHPEGGFNRFAFL